MTHTASAPGKVLLCGEYAVLDGAPAVVAAVARRAVAHVADKPAPLSPFLAAVHAELARRHGRDAPATLRAARIRVDSSALFDGEQKLGLGSSAAATVAAVAAALADDAPPLIHAVAHRAHAAAQAPRGARGSGADIAAAVWGGVLEVSGAGGLDAPAVRPLPWPADLTPVLVWTGHPADTVSLVARVREFATRAPAAHAACLAELAAPAAALAAALDRGDTSAAVAAIAAGALALAALGAAAGAPLVPDATEPLLRLARTHGGALKPTGAGGGDVLFALFPTPDRAAAFTADSRGRGVRLLDAPLAAAGVRLAPSGPCE